MTNVKEPKETSKRQARREQIRRKEQRGKILGVTLISVGALFLAFLLIYPSLQESLKPPEAVTTAEPREYPLADKLSLGSPDAPVKVDVYEDFQCPACLRFSNLVEPKIIENLVKTDKVYYTFHNYAFLDSRSFTKESQQAANAAMCAAEQNKFWEMHGVIFANWDGENRGAYADRRLRAFAETVGLDMGSFDSCFEANTYKAQIDADFELGNQIGVKGTPSVFVNGQFVESSYEAIAAAVEAAANE